LIVLNFSQPQGTPSSGIICCGLKTGKQLHVDLEDCALMGYKVFGTRSGQVSYTVRGKVTAYVQYRQPVPAGFERQRFWPVDVFAELMAPRFRNPALAGAAAEARPWNLDVFGYAERPLSQPLSVPLSFLSGASIRDKGSDKGRDKDDALAARLVPNVQTPAAAPEAPPRLIKLPVNFGNAMENTPVIYRGKPMLVLNRRDDTRNHTDGYVKSMALFVQDLATGNELARFGQGHSFASAYVNGDELDVFASEGTNQD
jgi:hypothetical protein